ncbi:MAG: helix-hairpin-helix domain-containing protein [Bacteroidales bacterium]|nr:helix-hairpin-helix domain-containing protein [Bacteroidales bacterium]
MSRPTDTQKRGLLWLALAAVLAVGAVLFSLPKHPQPALEAELQEMKAPDTAAVQRAQKRYKSYTRRSFRRQTPADKEATPWAQPQTDRTERARLVVDINTADTLTLQLLHGIGPTYARRIVAYRNRLGGYVSTSQLTEVYGFSDELYQHILPYLTLSTDSIRQIDMNTVTLKQLIRHPYIDYYQARDLIALRNSGVRFGSVQDLLLSPTMDEATLSRLEPYLKCDTTDLNPTLTRP